MWVEFVAGSFPCSERFFPGFLSKKKNIGRYLATYVALLGVEIWDPFRGGSQLDIDLHQCRGKMGCVY